MSEKSSSSSKENDMKVFETIRGIAGAGSRVFLLRAVLVVIMSAALSGMPMPAAQAAAPARVSFPVDVSYPVPELSAVCGFDVAFSMTGTFAGLVFKDRSGDTFRELDTQPGTKITWSSPTTGRSLTYPFSTVFHVVYPEGVEPGDPVTVSVTGLSEKIPGLSAGAGNTHLVGGTVLFVLDGVPYAEYGYPVSFHGRSNEPGVIDASMCAALAP
jgi:hypothetical protein